MALSNSTAVSNTTEGNQTKENVQLSCDKGGIDDILIYIVVTASVTIIVITAMALTWLKTYRSLKRTIRNLQKTEKVTPAVPEAHPLEQNSASVQVETVNMGQNIPSNSIDKRRFSKSNSVSLWRPSQTECQFNKADLDLHTLIKAGRDGVFYKAKMMHSTIKGHNRFTCKISKKGYSRRKVEKEVSVMLKLGTHKNLLQLLDWDITDTPYMLIMEYVAHGTLRSFLQVNQEELCRNNELQHLFTIAAYHIAHAMKHLHAKMILHCDLALRNILVHSFPHEVKVAEFGLAKEVTWPWSRHSSRKNRKQIPSRWYPPEYFRSDMYGFKGDVWAFGIVIWEMVTFGTLPYPHLKTCEEVAHCVCAGHRNGKPDQCRPEMLHMMKDCWQEPYSLRPSFMDIVTVLENILEFDLDYVDLDNVGNQNASVELQTNFLNEE